MPAMFEMSAEVIVPSVISVVSIVFAGSATFPAVMVRPFCPVIRPDTVVVESVDVPVTASAAPTDALPVVVSVPV